MKYDLEKLKQMSLESLCLFDEFCKEHNIRYALAFGTELGRVRHGGFIPWDDDVDIDMPIEDCLKFMKLWKKYGDTKGYFLQTKSNELYKPVLIWQLRKNGTTWIEPGKENIPMHWGIAIIDIFPYYHAPKTFWIRNIQQKCHFLASEFCFFAFNNPGASKLKKLISKYITVFMLQAVALISYASRKSNIAFYANTKRKTLFEYKEINETEIVKFEDRKFSGHKFYDNYLKFFYGDYMTPPPENERTGHAAGIIDLDKDYTFYIKGHS